MVCLRYLAARIMFKDAGAFGADFRSPDRPGDFRIEDLDFAAVGFPKKLRNLLAVVGSAVNNRQQHTVNLQSVINVLLHTGNSSQQLLNTFDGQVLRLHRDNDAICRRQCVDCQHAKRRAAIQQDMIVTLL